MSVCHYTMQNLALTSWLWLRKKVSYSLSPSHRQQQTSLDLLRPLRQWLDRMEVRNPKMAHYLCRYIPTQCPFERDIKLFGRTLLHIPPLCKLNPLYNEVVYLRFRAMCYLADECGEDVTAYC